ncbi:MAG: hypothetical protein U5K75_03790 [Ahrensia sp.]|nr:hypothetical protein [Ahrensia sp.]
MASSDSSSTFERGLLVEGFGYGFNGEDQQGYVDFDEFGTELNVLCQRNPNPAARLVCLSVAAELGGNPIDGIKRSRLNDLCWSVLANGYYDLPTIGGFAPYVGGGIDITRPTASVRR